jgi:hypothetical protein
MNFSFKAYATQFANFSLPVSALAVAKPLTRPISLRQVMNQGAPYAPDLNLFDTVDNSNNPNEVTFFWADDADIPAPWFQSSANPARKATSWTFQLWASNNASLVNATVGLNALQASGRVQYDHVGALIGDYSFQITAYNAYGSSSAKVNSVTITLPFNPVLNVTRSSAQSNSFILTGSGFKGGSSVAFAVEGGQTGAHALNPPPGSVTVGSDGTFTTSSFSCQSLCNLIGTGPPGLRFDALIDGTSVAHTTSTCVAT